MSPSTRGPPIATFHPSLLLLGAALWGCATTPSAGGTGAGTGDRHLDEGGRTRTARLELWHDDHSGVPTILRVRMYVGSSRQLDLLDVEVCGDEATGGASVGAPEVALSCGFTAREKVRVDDERSGGRRAPSNECLTGTASLRAVRGLLPCDDLRLKVGRHLLVIDPENARELTQFLAAPQEDSSVHHRVVPAPTAD